MARDRVHISSDDFDRMLGHHVTHVERVPIAGKGLWEWVLSVRPLAERLDKGAALEGSSQDTDQDGAPRGVQP